MRSKHAFRLKKGAKQKSKIVSSSWERNTRRREFLSAKKLTHFLAGLTSTAHSSWAGGSPLWSETTRVHDPRIIHQGISLQEGHARANLTAMWDPPRRTDPLVSGQWQCWSCYNLFSARESQLSFFFRAIWRVWAKAIGNELRPASGDKRPPHFSSNV